MTPHRWMLGLAGITAVVLAYLRLWQGHFGQGLIFLTVVVACFVAVLWMEMEQ